MFHASEEYFKQIEGWLLNYPVGEYVIAHETDPFSHYHILVQMEPEDYTKFRKRYFIDKLKLRGQAKKNLSRQYGKVSEIEDLSKMLSYTVKDENIISNMSDEAISDAIDNSFSKKKPKLLKDKLLKYLDDELSGLGKERNKKQIIILIIHWCRQNNIEIRRSLMDTYYFYFRQFSNLKGYNYKDEGLYRLLYEPDWDNDI